MESRTRCGLVFFPVILQNSTAMFDSQSACDDSGSILNLEEGGGLRAVQGSVGVGEAGVHSPDAEVLAKSSGDVLLQQTCLVVYTSPCHPQQLCDVSNVKR